MPAPLRDGDLKRRMPELLPRVFDASTFYTYDRDACFEIMDMPREQLEAHASGVAERIRDAAFGADAGRPAEGVQARRQGGCSARADAEAPDVMTHGGRR